MIHWWILPPLLLAAVVAGYVIRAEVELWRRSPSGGATLDFTRRRLGVD